MTDPPSSLVERLRSPRPRPGYPDPLPPHPWMVKAADEIERQALLLAGYAAARDEDGKQIDRLRALLEEVRNSLNVYPTPASFLRRIDEALGPAQETSK